MPERRFAVLLEWRTQVWERILTDIVIQVNFPERETDCWTKESEKKRQERFKQTNKQKRT